MSTIKNNINTYADLTAYNADLNKDFPNISYIQGTDEVKWADRDATLVVAYYDVNDTSAATKLLQLNTNVSKMYVDGVEKTVAATYQFDTTGEHKVIFELTNTSNFVSFTQVPRLKKLIIPNSVTTISDRCFTYTDTLVDLTIPDNVTTVGMDILENGDSSPKGGVSKIYIGSGAVITKNTSYFVGLLGQAATRRCNEIVVSPNNTTYDSRDNCNAIIETATNKLLVGCGGTVIPNTVTAIDSWAFYRSYNLTSITIPNSVTSINERAFERCQYLTNITIGSGVTSIGDYAFIFENYAAAYKKTVTVLATTPPTMGSSVFFNSNLTAIYVPAESVKTYKAASGWSTYASRIQAIPNS